jgi:glutathione S-transferase
LLEDWADEWWWRPAMHYRWFYPEGAHLQSRHLADELMGDVKAPGWLKRFQLRRRQRRGYTMGDGLSERSVPKVEESFRELLGWLEAIFSRRPFLLGSRPGLADIGFSGPFFRHFALDPVPLAIIRTEAPAVLEWVARLWNWRPALQAGEWVDGIPDDLSPLLENIGSVYLPYLCANAEAVAAGRKCFDVRVGDISYFDARSSRYRVWCLDTLRGHYEGLPDEERDQARELLERHGCWEPLWRIAELPLLPGQECGLPFRAGSKMLAVNE